jgi:steroid delta-isomerase-like uncharacterized protein
MTAVLSPERVEARLRLVEEHVARENAHDLEGILATFGASAFYEETPWGERYEGRAGVHDYYAGLMRAAPDFTIDVRRTHASGDAVLLEVIIRGTHTGPWKGLPGTGRRFEFPLCGVFTFDEKDRLAGEKIYYDRATVLRQLGVFFEPGSLLGKLVTPLTHPITIARALARSALRR